VVCGGSCTERLLKCRRIREVRYGGGVLGCMHGSKQRGRSGEVVWSGGPGCGGGCVVWCGVCECGHGVGGIVCIDGDVEWVVSCTLLSWVHTSVLEWKWGGSAGDGVAGMLGGISVKSRMGVMRSVCGSSSMVREA